MSTVTSADGTVIGYEKIGSGPALVLVDGAMCYRAFGPAKKYAEALQDRFTVYTYDRRGRGESTDTRPYAKEREIEDLAAVINEAGGSPYVFGASSGAALALDAANSGVPMTKLAVYEAPFALSEDARAEPAEYYPALTKALAEGRRGDAVKMFMKFVGVPGFMIAIMRMTPPWSKLKDVAPTLPYDRAFLVGANAGKPLPENRYAGAKVPVLSMAGGKSDEWFRTAMKQVADRLPDAQYRTIDGQNHLLKAQAIAPVLKDFFTEQEHAS
jgi:pimeloyl-ACP methyl ester carboxylesterase